MASEGSSGGATLLGSGGSERPPHRGYDRQSSGSAEGSGPQFGNGFSGRFPERKRKFRMPEGVGDLDRAVVVGVGRIQAGQVRSALEEPEQGENGIGKVDRPVGVDIPSHESGVGPSGGHEHRQGDHGHDEKGTLLHVNLPRLARSHSRATRIGLRITIHGIGLGVHKPSIPLPGKERRARARRKSRGEAWAARQRSPRNWPRSARAAGSPRRASMKELHPGGVLLP